MGNSNKTEEEQSNELKNLISKDKKFEHYYLNSYMKNFQRALIYDETDSEGCMNCTCTMGSRRKKKNPLPNKVRYKNYFMNFDSKGE